MPEKFDLLEMLAEIEENNRLSAERSNAQLTQGDIRKLVTQQLGDMLPAGDSDSLERDESEEE